MCIRDRSGAAAKFLDMGGEVEVIAGFQYEMLDVPNDGYLDFYLWPKYSPHGYVWMIPKEGGRANVGLVTTDKKGAIKYLESFIQDTYLNGKPTVNPPWREQKASRSDPSAAPFRSRDHAPRRRHPPSWCVVPRSEWCRRRVGS